MHSEADIIFEDGTTIVYKEFVHTQTGILFGFKPAVIRKTGAQNWDNYITEEDEKNPEYSRTTYEQQLDFLRRISTGGEVYDMDEDADGLGVEANIKLHQILDEIFVKGGFSIKTGV